MKNRLLLLQSEVAHLFARMYIKICSINISIKIALNKPIEVRNNNKMLDSFCADKLICNKINDNVQKKKIKSFLLIFIE